MMENLIGQRFGMLTVKAFDRKELKNGQYKYFWLCECECGSKKSIRSNDLKTGKVISCGCHRRSGLHYIHGGCGTKLYTIWENMKKRCMNPKCERYTNYGGRGISVCDEWLNFSNFQKWAFENGYIEGLSIERKDVNKNYEPSNCCWIPIKNQSLNKTNSVKITFQGKTQNLCLWCKELNLNERLIGERMRRGWSFEKAITTPIDTRFRPGYMKGAN